jgi:ADP-ribosyl-[dinitrogen reductase] hydrolase
LPYEGLSSQRAQRLLGPPTQQRLCRGYGLVSDDTDHALLTAMAYGTSLRNGVADVAAFERHLAWQLRFWLLSLPPGVGLATLRACVRLCLGIPPQYSGVVSAGNGPAMRAVVLGVLCSDLDELKALIHSASHITHRDERAEHGALAIAVLAHCFAQGIADGHELDVVLQHLDKNSELSKNLRLLQPGLDEHQEVEQAMATLGLRHGVSGYINHTVPVVMYTALRYRDDFSQAVQKMIACGGDTDTTAALVGGLLGVRVGVEAIPEAWRTKMWLWPYSWDGIALLAQRLGNPLEPGPLRVPQPPLMLRLIHNLLALVVVLYHGFRRLLPPY